MPLWQTSEQLKHTSLLVSLEYCPGAQCTHVRSVVLLGVFEARSPAGQDVHCWQMVSMDAVPLMDAKEPLAQPVCISHRIALVSVLSVFVSQSLQTRLAAAEGAMDMKVPGPHSASG